MPEPTPGAGQARSQATSLPSPAPKPLAGRFVDLLRDGHGEGGDYATPRGAVMAIACALARSGHPIHEFRAHMLDPANRLAEQYRMRVKRPFTRYSDRDFNREIDKAWKRACELVAATPHAIDGTEALQVIGEAKAAASAHHWGGRAGLRNREVLSILHAVAQERCTASPSVSVREILRRSAYRSVEPIVNALAALREAGWIDSRRESDPGLPSTHHLRLPAPFPKPNSLTGVPAAAAPKHTVDRDGESAEGMAVARLHGAHAAAIWSALTDEPANWRTLVERSGVSKSAVFRWLPRLAASGLAHQTPDGWVSSSDGLPDAQAEAADVEALRDARIKLDREGWSVWVEQRRESVDRSRKAEAEAKRRAAWKRRGERG